MSADYKKQEVSALTDGGLSEAETHQTIRALSEDPELRVAWERYHLIGDAIRGEALRLARRSVADEVARRLATEPTVLAPRHLPRLRTGHWTRPVAGGALAAGVAILGVLAAPRFLGIDQPAGPSMALNMTPVQAAADAGASRWRHVGPAVEAKLNRFLVDHGEYVTPASVPRVLPYASFVSYEAGR